jgi:hypothetical protein
MAKVRLQASALPPASGLLAIACEVMQVANFYTTNSLTSCRRRAASQGATLASLRGTETR